MSVFLNLIISLLGYLTTRERRKLAEAEKNSIKIDVIEIKLGDINIKL